MAQPAKTKAHEHFCAYCYGHKTNGQASGWWRCVDKKCTRREQSACSRHTADLEEEGAGR